MLPLKALDELLVTPLLILEVSPWCIFFFQMIVQKELANKIDIIYPSEELKEKSYFKLNVW